MNARNMDVHRLVGFASGFLVHKARSLTFNLNAGASFLLDVFNEHALVSDVSLLGECIQGELTDGPTTLARTLKFLMVSSPTGIFSSGHFLCQPPPPKFQKTKVEAQGKRRTLSFSLSFLSSTSGPRSTVRSSFTLSIAL